MREIILFLSVFLLLACTESKRQQAILLFEEGKKQEERKAADSAVIAYNKAIKLLEQTNEKVLQGEIYNRIGNLYLNNNLEYDASIAFQTALKYNSALVDKSKASYSFRGIGNSYGHRFVPDSALYYHLQAYNLLCKVEDPEEIVKIYNNLANSYLSLKQYKNADKCNSKALQLTKDSTIIYACYSIKAQIFNSNQQYDSAFYYFKLGTYSNYIYTKAACYLQLAALAGQMGDSNRILYMDQAQILKDSIDMQNRSACIANIDKHLIQSRRAEEKHLFTVYIINILLIGSLLMLLLIYYHRRKVKIKQANIQKTQRQLQYKDSIVQKLQIQLLQVKEELQFAKESNKSKSELYAKEQQLELTRKTILTNIKEVGELSATKFMKLDLFKAMKATIATQTLSQRIEYKKQIQEAFKSYIKQLSAFVIMSEDDYFLCCLFLLKLNTKECANLRCLTDNSIRTQKSRIREKIGKVFGIENAFETLFPIPDKKRLSKE